MLQLDREKNEVSNLSFPFFHLTVAFGFGFGSASVLHLRRDAKANEADERLGWSSKFQDPSS
jgi:hypothetical protein